MGTLPADDPRPRKKRKNSKAESTPIWERTRTFGTEKRKTASLPVIENDGHVKRLNVQRPKFTARAKNPKSRRRVDVVSEEDNTNRTTQPDTSRSKIAQSGHSTNDRRKNVRRNLEDFAKKIERFEDVKARIADIASKVVANPERNVALLKELRQMAQQFKGKTAALVILTESQLYKDIIPTYRIREITEKEAETKVSKDVARLRTYEEKLLAGYQRFVKSCISMTKWRTGGGAETEASRNMSKVRLATCRALSELIRSLSHFNEADVIANCVCALVADREQIVRSQSASALSSVLGDAHRASGQTLQICVLIAKQLANVAVGKVHAAPAEVVEPLVEIQFARFAKLPPSTKAKNAPKKSKRFIKKRRRKPEKGGDEREETELVRDLREGDAEASPQELYAARKKLLNSVCHAYFNIIKTAANSVEQVGKEKDKGRNAVRKKRPPMALPAALKGLLRVASFISADIIEAILGALTPLLELGRLPLTMRFRCLSAAYAVLAVHARTQQTDPDSFIGDAHSMDACLYTTLGCLYGPDMPVKEDENITFDAVEAVLSCMSFREVPAVRSTAIARRLAVLAASLAPTHACAISLLTAAQEMLPSALVYPIYQQKLDKSEKESEWGNEAAFIQEYDMATNDPEIANAERSAAWELSCLAAHFHPKVRDIALKTASGYCGARLPKASENILLTVKGHSSAEGGFNPPPQSQMSNKSKKSKREFDFRKDAVLCSFFGTEENRLKFEADDTEVAGDYFEKHWCETDPTVVSV